MSYKHGQMNHSNLPSGHVCQLSNNPQNINTYKNGMARLSRMNQDVVQNMRVKYKDVIIQNNKQEKQINTIVECVLVITTLVFAVSIYSYFCIKRSKYQKRCDALVQQMKTNVSVDIDLWQYEIEGYKRSWKKKYELLLIFQKIIQHNKSISKLTRELANLCVSILAFQQAKKNGSIFEGLIISKMSEESRIEIENAFETIEYEYKALICTYARRCRASKFKGDSKNTVQQIENNLNNLVELFTRDLRSNLIIKAICGGRSGMSHKRVCDIWSVA